MTNKFNDVSINRRRTDSISWFDNDDVIQSDRISDIIINMATGKGLDIKDYLIQFIQYKEEGNRSLEFAVYDHMLEESLNFLNNL